MHPAQPTVPPPRARVRQRVWLAVSAAVGLAAASTLTPALLSSASAATSGCSVSYTNASEWSGGFVANLVITNTGSSDINGWTLTFAFPGDQKITSSWSATVTQSAENVTAVAESYNADIAAGATTNFGFQGTFTTSDAVPTSFAINGVTCGATSSTSPSASPTTSASASASPTSTGTSTASTAAPQLHVSGNKLVDANGNTVVLHGMDRSGTEYECVQGSGIFDGPSDQASITAMKSWGPVNAVRVPLNEACWNGESYVDSAYAGSTYQQAIVNYVNLLNSNGIAAILDLHWTDGAYTGSSSGCSSAEAVCQKPMPDAAEAIPF